MIEGVRIGPSAKWAAIRLTCEAERFEQDRQQAVQLEAAAAPVSIDDFLVNGRDIERKAPVERAYLEVLEGHGVEVRPLDRRERLGRWRQWPTEADPRQVSLDLLVREFSHAACLAYPADSISAGRATR